MNDDERAMETSPGQGNISRARPWNRPGERDEWSTSGPWACNSIWVGFGFENNEDFFLPFCFFLSFVICKVIRVSSLIKFEPLY
jgi:hypothetical protein